MGCEVYPDVRKLTLSVNDYEDALFVSNFAADSDEAARL